VPVRAIGKITLCPSPAAVSMISNLQWQTIPDARAKMHRSGGLALASRPETGRRFADESANPTVKHPLE